MYSRLLQSCRRFVYEYSFIETCYLAYITCRAILSFTYVTADTLCILLLVTKLLLNNLVTKHCFFCSKATQIHAAFCLILSSFMSKEFPNLRVFFKI